MRTYLDTATKMEIVESFYKHKDNRMIADAYVEHMDNTMMDIDSSKVFTGDHKTMMTKMMVQAQIERIFDSAHRSNRSLFSSKWKTAQGFAKGAAVLIHDVRDDKISRTFIMAVAQHVLVEEYKVPLQNARLLITQYL